MFDRFARSKLEFDVKFMPALVSSPPKLGTSPPKLGKERA